VWIGRRRSRHRLDDGDPVVGQIDVEAAGAVIQA
jgi:hypothetical protein